MSAQILITGASGAAGRFITSALRDAGYRVRAQYARAPAPIDGVDWRQHDFLASSDLSELIAGCEAVIHCAAELRDEARMEALNVTATRRLGEAAARAGVRYFGHASSIVVYGSPRTRDVDESTPRLDPRASMSAQYHAEPYMLAYARSKTLAEEALAPLATQMRLDLFRPAVVADTERLLEALAWSRARRLFALYRRTQYIFAPDAAAAVVHLLTRGLAAGGVGAEAYNICDAQSGTYRDVFRRAYEVTKDARFSAPFDAPYVADVAKCATAPAGPFRFPLGMLRLSNAKLLGAGFVFPTGFAGALDMALARLNPATQAFRD